MAEPTRKGVALWQGVVGTAHATYTLSHGITPGCILLSINPQPLGSFASEGDMIFDDGVSRIVLRDCKVLSLKRRGDTQQGFVDTVEILDHRWRWQLGAISGTFNLLDDNKKLIGWSIRSPTELAILCLRAMGETKFDINLPPGLSSTAGSLAFQLNPPWMGVVPITGTNPPVNWEGEIPACALASLCESFGRRVIYRWKDNSVLIDIPGRGSILPPGSIASESPSIRDSMRPSGVGVLGAPTRYQSRLLTEPVGEEWHGGIIPINQLSYAPVLPRVNQSIAIQGENLDAASPTIGLPPTGSYFVGIGKTGINPFANPAPHVDINSAVFEYVNAGGDTWTTVQNGLAVAINASPWGALVEAAPVSDGSIIRLTITGKPTVTDPEYIFFSWGTSIRLPLLTDVVVWDAFLLVAGSLNQRGWDYIAPPSAFVYGVQPVPGRLTRIEASQLAMKTVWRMFRIKANSDGSYPIIVPGYGALARRQQIVLEDTKVEQITPARDFVRESILTRELQDLSLNFYNGYSHNKPLAVFGEVAKLGRDVLLWPGSGRGPGLNSDPHQQLLLSFSVNPIQQTIYCGERYCFKIDGGRYIDPKLIVETGYTLRNANSNAFEQLVATLPLLQYADLSPYSTLQVGGRTPTGAEVLRNSNVATQAIVFSQGVIVPTPRRSPTAYKWRTYSDIQVGVIGQYDFGPLQRKVCKISGANFPPSAGAVFRVGLGVQGVNPFTAPVGAANAKVWSYTTVALDTYTIVAGNLVAQIQADADWNGYVQAELLDGTGDFWISLTGLVDGPDQYLFFEAAADVDAGEWTMNVTTPARLPFASETLSGFTYLEADPFMRARYYLQGMALQYIDELGQTSVYNGFEPIDVDGAIQQVTWEVDKDGGCSTTASVNNEHNIWVPPYPARRRTEFLQGNSNQPGTTSRGDIGRNFFAPVAGIPPTPRVV